MRFGVGHAVSGAVRRRAEEAGHRQDEATPLLADPRRGPSARGYSSVPLPPGAHDNANLQGGVRARLRWLWSVQQITQRTRGPQGFAVALVESGWLRVFVIAMVALNCLLIGAEIDAPGIFRTEVWFAIDTGFNAIYTAEVVLKIMALGLRGYFETDLSIFDPTVTVLAWVEILTTMGLTYSGFKKLPKLIPSDFVQILRLLRIVKLATISKSFMLIVESFIHAGKALGWVMVFGFMWFFLTACVATVFLGGPGPQLQYLDPDGGGLGPQSFRNIPNSMYSMFELMLLEGWPAYIRPFLKVNRLGAVFFLFLCMFVSFFLLLNILTAVVVEKLLTSQHDQGAKEHMESEEAEARLTTGLSGRLLKLNRGEDVISKQEFRGCLEDSQVADLMEKMGRSRSYALLSFDVCDHDCGGEASLEQLGQLWGASKRQLTMADCVRFQHHVGGRLLLGGQLGTAIMKAATQMAESRSLTSTSGC